MILKPAFLEQSMLIHPSAYYKREGSRQPNSNYSFLLMNNEDCKKLRRHAILSSKGMKTK
jgi:hypothetical protein